MVKISVKTKIPKDPLNFAIFEKHITDKMRSRTRPGIRKLFNQTVDGWRNKPVFTITISSVVGKRIRLFARPTGRHAAQWRLVALGARAHKIAPRTNRGFLIYKRGYRASTRPGSLSSRRSGRFGPTILRKHSVSHPGFKGRDFHNLIAETYQDTFVEDMTVAIRAATRDLARFSFSS